MKKKNRNNSRKKKKITLEINSGQKIEDLVLSSSIDNLLIPTTTEKIIPVTVENNNDDRKLLLGLISDLAYGLWRTRLKILSNGNVEPPEAFKKVFLLIDSTYQKMLQSGVEILDPINTRYVEGMKEHVLAFEPHEELTQDTIIQTIKPTIKYKDEIILTGEIIVGTSVHEKTRRQKKQPLGANDDTHHD
jgi:hypothetical protein